MVTINVQSKTVTVNRLCVITKKPYEVTVPLKGYSRWQNGEFIHVAMPDVSAEDREFLLSSISPEGWAVAQLDEPDSMDDVDDEEEET